MMAERMTREELLGLPAVLGVEEAGRALGISRQPAYDLVAVGQFPVPVLKVGKRYRISTDAILKYLGVDPANHALRTQPSTSNEGPNNSSVVRTRSGKVIRPEGRYRDRETGRIYDGEDITAMARVLGVAS